MDERGAADASSAAPARVPAGPPAAIELGPLLVAAGAAWLAVDLLGGLEHAHPAAPGEAAWLRWVRMIAAHPVRSKVGLAWILWGLIPRRSPTVPAPSDGDGGSWKAR